MTSRVALYARYSTDMQRDASIEDQLRLCREHAVRHGWEVVDSYSDRAVSGASTHTRPGLHALLADAGRGQFDIVMAEALDRLSRDQEDIAGIYKRLTFAGITLFTVSESEVSELHIGLKGTMNALLLKDLAAKTHRGLRGRVEAGKSAGGLCYGYRPDIQITANAIVERGSRRIEEAEATIVKRIFQNFADGLSPIAIAKQLNAEAIPGPNGRPWQDTTIRGHAERATGILRNELYIGRLVWNRMHYLKDPSTGKRVSRMNPPEQWIREEVPALRIVGDELWAQVQHRLNGIRERSGANNPDRPKFWETRRTRHLLTGKLFCANCGGQLSNVGRDYLACGAARKRGTCTNMASIRRSQIEQMVLDALRHNLMQPEAVAEFITAFTAEWNRLAAEQNSSHAQDKSHLATLQRKIDRIVEAITEGYRTPEMKTQLDDLNRQKESLQARLSSPKAPTPSLHPNLAALYREKVSALHNELQAATGDNSAALNALRDLIERVDLGPGTVNRAANRRSCSRARWPRWFSWGWIASLLFQRLLGNPPDLFRICF